MNSACTEGTTRSFAINIAERGRPLLPRVSQDGLSIRAGLILVAITASCGLVWIGVGEFKKLFSPSGGSSNLSRQIIYSSASITDSDAGLAVGRMVPEAGRTASIGDSPKQHPSPASGRETIRWGHSAKCIRHRPFAGVAAPCSLYTAQRQ
jgi:hypothetical protein